MTQQPSIAHALCGYLAAWQPPHFDWRDHHCGSFAAGWVRLRTGRDFLAGLEAHRTQRQWRRVVAGDMAELVTRQCGVLPLLATLAQAGDVVLLPGAMAGGTLCICAGPTAVGVDESGACVHVPMSEARCAWPLRMLRAVEQASEEAAA